MQEQEQSKIEVTVDSIKDYANTQYELMLLKGSDKIAHLGSNALSAIPIIMFSVLTILMLSFALAFYLNEKMMSQYCGFLVVGGGYFVIVLLFILMRKSMIVKPLRNLIIRELLKNKNIHL
ncbi:MAG: phage holin family protein [Bacteroidota bacterium]